MSQRPLYLFVAGLFLAMVGFSLFPRPEEPDRIGVRLTEVEKSHQVVQSYFAAGMVIVALGLIIAGIVLARRQGR